MSESVQLNTIYSDSNTVINWLGSFWTQIYTDSRFLQLYQGSRGMLASQLYLNLLEVSGLLDRNAAPVVHRERWYPLIIRRSQRGQGGEAAVRLGMDPAPVLGRQLEGSEFPEGKYFQIGGYTQFVDIVTYPVDTTAQTVCTAIVDNIVQPNKIWTDISDFIVRNGCLILRKDLDPFNEDSAFTKTTIVENGVEDEEVVLWACDALFDRDYLYRHIGYVLGVRTPSTDYYKRMLNKLWDLLTDGATRDTIGALIAAIYDKPVVLSDDEIVEAVYETTTQKVVVTDKNTYIFDPTDTLKDNVKQGYVTRKNERMDTSIKIYSNVTDTAQQAMQYVEDGDDFRIAIPTVSLPSTFFRASLQYGLTAGWTHVPIYSAGLDSNGNPKLWFPFEGSQADVSSYWVDVWAYCETRNLSTLSCFQSYLNDIVDFSDGALCGYVSPLEYVLHNFIGANTVLISVDTTTSAQSLGTQSTAACAKLLRELIPAYTYIYVIEHRTVDKEEYDLESNTENGTTDLLCSLATSSSGTYGNSSVGRLTYKDRPIRVSWVPICR